MLKGVLVINPALAPAPIGSSHIGDNIIVDESDLIDDSSSGTDCVSLHLVFRVLDYYVILNFHQLMIRGQAGQKVRMFDCANQWYQSQLYTEKLDELERNVTFLVA